MTDTPTTTSPSGGSAPQAIYRRFRAQTFAQMVGQEAVVQTLRNAVRLGRVGHAFLFVGPRGTGKTSMARILAKAVNCTDLRDGEPCDACSSCVAIRDGRALDVIELDAASNNKVDDMRELVPRVYTAAADLRHKVFIIDEVQRIKEGWDVLLKTLEEPPSGVVFIFCTTDPSQIRPAVVSRLQRFTFRPLATTEIEGKLSRILESEGRTVEPSAVALIARLAGGGMRDAESMLDQVLVSTPGPIAVTAIADLFGLADEVEVDGFIEALVAGDVLAGIAILDALEAEGRDLVAFSEQMVTRLREVLVARLASASGEQRAEARALAGVARRLTGIDASRSGLGGYRWQLELCLLAAADAPRAAADGGALRPAAPTAARPSGAAEALPAAPPAVAHQPPVKRQSAAPSAHPAPADGGTHPRPVPARSPADLPDADRSASPADLPDADRPGSPGVLPDAARPRATSGHAAPADLDAIRASWPQIVATIGRNPANRPLVATCRPVDMRDGVLVLGFPEDQAFMRDIAERKRLVLEDGIVAVMGRPVAVRCVVTNLELAAAVDPGEGDLVAQAQRIFGGELVGVEDIDA